MSNDDTPIKNNEHVEANEENNSATDFESELIVEFEKESRSYSSQTKCKMMKEGSNEWSTKTIRFDKRLRQ